LNQYKTGLFTPNGRLKVNKREAAMATLFGVNVSRVNDTHDGLKTFYHQQNDRRETNLTFLTPFSTLVWGKIQNGTVWSTKSLEFGWKIASERGQNGSLFALQTEKQCDDNCIGIFLKNQVDRGGKAVLQSFSISNLQATSASSTSERDDFDRR